MVTSIELREVVLLAAAVQSIVCYNMFNKIDVKLNDTSELFPFA